MGNTSDVVLRQADAEGEVLHAAVPVLLGILYFCIGLFFMRPNMGEPDSYREALSAFQYIEEGTYGSYWDHPLTMYLFVAATRICLALDVSQTAVVNTLAVLLGSLSVWPFYHLVRRLVNWRAATFASVALILSPAFIRFSTYLSHETVGFACALWSLYLFDQALTKRSRLNALVFGLCFGATWSARPTGAMFIAPPLLLLLSQRLGAFGLLAAARLLLFSLLGALGCLLLVYRPELIMHLASRPGSFFFTYYEFGRYIESTSLIALSALTPVLAGLALIGAGVLAAQRRLFPVLFGSLWALPVYLFYIGMYCTERYFMVLLPPFLLLCFGGADEIDSRYPVGRGGTLHVAKVVTVFLLVLLALGPCLPDLLYARQTNDDKVAAETIGELVGRNLLFTTALTPVIRYYNREHPPEIVYLVSEHSPGKLSMRMDKLQLAQEHLREGRPVFATDEIIRQFQFVGINAEFELVWEYKSLGLFRITGLRLADGTHVGLRIDRQRCLNC